MTTISTSWCGGAVHTSTYFFVGPRRGGVAASPPSLSAKGSAPGGTFGHAAVSDGRYMWLSGGFGHGPKGLTKNRQRSAFSDALQKAFPPQLAVHDITDGTPGVMVESYPGLPKYVWNNASAPLLATFLSGWLKDHGFDGLYMGAPASAWCDAITH